MQDRLYQDFYLPDETVQMRSRFRDFAENELFPKAYDIGQRSERNENFPYLITYYSQHPI